jgi:AraC-like DNA-binding protein
LKTESPHRHTFYEILFITDGEGTHIVDFETYALRPPMVFFVSPGQVHFWRLSKFLEGHALLFSEDFLVFPGAALNQADEIGFFHTVGKAPELVLKNDQRIKINLLLEYIQQERITAALNQASVLRAWLHVLIVELQRLFAATRHHQKETYESRVVRKFKRLIAERFTEDRSITNYARDLCLSTSHLSNILKSMTGCSPGRLIRNEIVLEAKRLLVHSDLTVAEIGYRLNFEDPSYFARFFRREAGLSPTTFRQDIRRKYQLFR